MSITPKIGDKIRTTGHTGVIVDTYTYPAGKVIYGIKWARETEVQHFSHRTIAQWMPKYELDDDQLDELDDDHGGEG